MAPPECDIDELRDSVREIELWRAELVGVDGKSGAFGTQCERCKDAGLRTSDELRTIKADIAVLKQLRTQILLLVALVSFAMPYLVDILRGR